MLQSVPLPDFLLTDFSTAADHAAILQSLLVKSRSRGIHPSAGSLSNPEIRRRAEADYGTLADEIEGELPAFPAAYDKIERFYRSLPWDCPLHANAKPRPCGGG